MVNHLWQSTMFALVAGLLTLAFRRNKAQVRYWLWLSASVKFLLPFALLMSLGSLMPQAKTVVARPPAIAVAAVEIAQPFSDRLPVASSSPRAADWEPVVLLCAWLSGFFGVAIIRLRGWLRIRAAVRSSTRIEMPTAVEVRSSPGLLEPGVVGFLRPILLLPAGIEERLTAAQLQAVLAHELAHVRRRDNVTSAIHMLVEAIFWFHPLVWWIGARLVEERERACDEAVLSLGSEPRDYAEGILNVCKLYVESPLACVSGVTGANLKRRIEAIMKNRRALQLTWTKKAVIVAAGIAAFAGPAILGMLKAQSVVVPKWEVATVRPCESSGDSKQGGGGGGRGPGRLSTGCSTVRGFIWQAYVFLPDGRVNPQQIPIEGGPAWINSESYAITAKAEGTPSSLMMSGPMLQALLEDRFKLKIRRESREVPVYDLVVAKGGFKLHPLAPGSCVVADDPTKPDSPPPPPDAKGYPMGYFCKQEFNRRTGSGRTTDFYGMTLDEFAKFNGQDRPVVDKTGIAGMFNFHLEYEPDWSLPGALPPGAPIPEPSGGPSIFTAMEEQLGLKLEPAKGPGPYLVIDSIEHPSEN